jgi:hypothetical protein
MYEYLVVPFLGQLKKGVFNNADADDVSKQLQALINKHVGQGWEFYTINDVNIEVKPGCLAGLFGSSSSFISIDQVIFRKQKKN